jgi:hypothetical protein
MDIPSSDFLPVVSVVKRVDPVVPVFRVFETEMVLVSETFRPDTYLNLVSF